jgi:hypothetical protein
MADWNKTLIYITEPVYRAYYKHISSKDLCIFLYPATADEMNNVNGISRSDVFDIQQRMPEWWFRWYYRLSLDEKMKFAKIIEQRLKNYQLI